MIVLVGELASSFSHSPDLWNHSQRISSFFSQASFHTERTCFFENFSNLLMNRKASCIGQPKTMVAGEMLRSGSGLLCSCIIARRNLSVLKSSFDLATNPGPPSLDISSGAPNLAK